MRRSPPKEKHPLRGIDLTQLRADLRNLTGDLATTFPRWDQRRSLTCYLEGLLASSERKTRQPTAARMETKPNWVRSLVNGRPWNANRVLADHCKKFYSRSDGTRAAIVLDEVQIRKQGQYSVGVARRAVPFSRRRVNCQTVLTWHWTTDESCCAMGIRLHLPNEWIQNPARLDRCGVPMAIRRSREKWETALDLLAEIRDLIPRSSVLILDENYGAMPPLLAELERRQANYVAKIPHDIRKWPFVLAECFAGRPTQPVTKRDWQAGIRRLCGWLWDLNLEGTPWRQIEVRGSGKQTLDMFAKPLVMAPSERPYDPKSERRWLFVLRKDEALFGNWDYYVSNLPLSTSPSELAEFALRLNATKERQRQLNSRLGLAHFEGRSWHGLHHHVTLCHLAGAFLSERERH